MTPLRDLDLFVAVARAGSFTDAARATGMPVSTLSRRVAELEGSLGLPLFVRSTRHVALTEAGALYLPKCEAIVDAAREAQEQLRGLAETPAGLLRISLEAEIGVSLVAPVVAEFLGQHPAVTVDLDLSPRRVDLMAEGFDLAVRIGSLPDSSLTVRRIGTLSVGLFASPDYLARRGTPHAPADLAQHARLHLMHQHDTGEWVLHGAGGQVAVVPSGSLVSANNMMMIRALARHGLGIAVMDEVMAAEDDAAGALVRVLPEWRLRPSALSVLTPARLLPAKTRAFVDLLARRMADRVRS